MAIVWLESFGRNFFQRYTTPPQIWSATGGRNNGPRIADNLGAYPKYPAPSGNTCLFHVRAFAGYSGSATQFGPCWGTGDFNTLQCCVCFQPGGTVSVRRGQSTVLAQTSLAGQYNCELREICFECVIDDTVGSTRVLIDGVEVPELTLTNVNTKAIAGGLWNSFWIKGAGGVGCVICDLCIADGTDPSGLGYDLHELQPEIRVDYRPAAGNGYSSQLVGQDSDSVNNYLNVDETGAPDNDTSYNQSDVPAIDGYTLGPVPVEGGTVIGCMATAVVRKTDAGTAIMKVGMRSGSTNLLGDAQALPVSWYDLYQHIQHDPNNGAWTEAVFNSSQVVIEKT